MRAEDSDFRVIFDRIAEAESVIPRAGEGQKTPDFAEMEEIRRLREIVEELAEPPHTYFSRT